MPELSLKSIDWAKGDGLVPAVIQDATTGQVLMLGYMNQTALETTISSGRVTFFSRSKQRLWTKGETSDNWLTFVRAEIDCDGDTVLVQAKPEGPACHTGSTTCFNDHTASDTRFLDELGELIAARHKTMPKDSYTTSLFTAGKARIAQKVGEEGVELALARMKDDRTEMTNEAADLIFHMLVLLEDANLSLADVVKILRQRHAGQRAAPQDD